MFSTFWFQCFYLQKGPYAVCQYNLFQDQVEQHLIGEQTDYEIWQVVIKRYLPFTAQINKIIYRYYTENDRI